MDKLSVWYNGCDWVVAESAEDALEREDREHLVKMGILPKG